MDKKIYRAEQKRKRKKRVKRRLLQIFVILLLTAAAAAVIAGVFFGGKALLAKVKDKFSAGDVITDIQPTGGGEDSPDTVTEDPEKNNPDGGGDEDPEPVEQGTDGQNSDTEEQTEPNNNEPDGLEEPDVQPPVQQTSAVYEENGACYVDIKGTRILVVNKVYALSSSYGGYDAEADAALRRMYDAAAADGISLWTVSGYRSYEDQAAIHQGWINKYGAEHAKQISAEPGHSEHQTGMAFDINSLATKFCETAEYRWLKANCGDFGFIERYPETKTGITGYDYEPWHYRYIGSTEIANEIMDSGVSLEEYLGLA